MTTVALTSDTADAEDVYAEVSDMGVDNPGFEADINGNTDVKAGAAPSPALTASVDMSAQEGLKTDENDNFYANLSVDGPGALDPAIKVNDSVDPGVKALHSEGVSTIDDDFPGEDFWAGCRTMDLNEWVESVKTQPPDKVKPCVLNSSLPKDLQLKPSKEFVDIVDPVFRDGRLEGKPPARSFSYIKTNSAPEFQESMDCNECMSKGNCCSNVDKGMMNKWFWIGLAIFLIAIIVIIGIVVGVRGDDDDG